MHNLYITVIVIIFGKASGGTVVTHTAQGILQGRTEDGYDSYIGIPYATVNGSVARFKVAGPAPSWRGVRELPRERDSCYPSSGSPEDCLQLDVHVPAGSPSDRWPVMVWIQGGPGRYHPGALTERGLILVMVNYRVGPLGFLCLNNDKIAANVGVKDIVMALKWIRDNIVAFRGNPNKVTVAGHSFGAALIEGLILSQMSESLFQGAILQSGSVLCPWAFNYDAESRAKMLVTLFTESSDEDDIAKALVRAKPLELMEKAKKLYVPYFPFTICAENKQKRERKVITEAPIKILKSQYTNNIPIMIGYNTDEGYIFANYLKRVKALKKIKRDLTLVLPEELIFRSSKEVEHVMRQVKDSYFADNTTLRALLTYQRDALFVSHIHRSARLHAAANSAPVFYYEFSYNGELGIEPETGVKKAGAAHSDELAYLFPEDGRTLAGEHKSVQDRLLTLWSNFVKQLNPTPSSSDPLRWTRVNHRDPRLLSIGLVPEMKDFPYSRTTQLWDDIYDKHYYKKYDTV